MEIERGSVGGNPAGFGVILRRFFSASTLDHSPVETEGGGAAAATPALRWRALRRWPKRKREAVFWTAIALVALLLFFQLSSREHAPRASVIQDRSFRERIPAGKLAYALETDSLIPLRRGDLLDLFLLAEGPQGGAFLQGALVLDASSLTQPIVALSEEEIRWVEMARQKGKLKIAVRSAAESIPRRSRPPRRSQSPKKRSSAIQILEEE
jgi:hypothetical protein